MYTFYSDQISSNQAVIYGDEFNHCKNVLRLQVGNNIRIADGNGSFFAGTIAVFQKDKALIESVYLESLIEKNGNYWLNIAISPTKNIDRIEWFVEKAVEIGVDRITFIQSKRTERKNINHERLLKIAIAAMKQSGRAWLPEITKLQVLSHYIDNVSKENELYIAHLVEGEERNTIKELLIKKEHKSVRAEVLIGPEGDFTLQEVELAIAKGFRPVSLGSSRLRTETAGMVACANFKIVFE